MVHTIHTTYLLQSDSESSTPRREAGTALLQRRLSSHTPQGAAAPTQRLPSFRQSASLGRERRSTMDSVKNTTGKLKIGMDDDRSLDTRIKLRPEVRFNFELALRTAVGVIIAAQVMTKASRDSNNLGSSNAGVKQWYFFPEWYILGGLSYAATATVFGCGKNIGATIRELFQQISGVGIALLYNLVIFSTFQPQVFNTVAELNAAKVDGTLTHITHAFSGSPYWVHQRDFFTILPFIIGFTLVTLLLPLETNTKKYMIGNNLYFALTLVSPNDFTNPALLKAPGSDTYKTANIMRNLEVYMLLGVSGACIAQLVLWLPYPLFAIRQLQAQTKTCAATLEELLNIIVDTYCFKNKDVEHMNFLRQKLKRKFTLAVAKHDKMNELLKDVWWEQAVGLHFALNFRKPSTKAFIELFGSQIENLRAMYQAIILERYESLHEVFMKSLQREVYIVQLNASNLVDEISVAVHNSATDLTLRSLPTLEKHMEALLTHFQQSQNRIYKKQKPSPSQVEANVPLNLFLFSLQSYCTTVVDFEDKFNGKLHKTGSRMWNFCAKALSTYVDKSKYPRDKVEMAFKVTLAILAACFFSVYTFSYSSTTAGAVAYVMGNHIGGSFSVTANRVGGVIAGSIIPSICLFYICSYACTSSVVVAITTYIILFVWVTFSMYIKWKGGFEAYAGLISAFTVTQVLLKGCDGCQSGSVAPISSYSNLAQMSLGIVLFIIVEMMICPQSAMALLRGNVQKQLKLYEQCFKALVEDTLDRDGAVVDDAASSIVDEIHDIVHRQLPSLLTEQAALLKEAAFEPLLWKPPFSAQKYEAVLDCCQRLLNNTLVLYKLTQWYKGRMKLQAEKKRDAATTTAMLETPPHAPPNEPWGFSTVEASRAIHDTFETLHHLFGDNFTYADGDQTALFMQMKEAFRQADTDCSGEIDAEEVKTMLQTIFAQSGAVKVDAIDTYVAEFMRVVDKDESGKVSLEEFIDALEHGLQLQVQVFQHRSKKVAALMPTIGEGDERDSEQEEGHSVTSRRRASTIDQADRRRGRDSSKDSKDEADMTRAHDMLNVDSFSLLDTTQAMRTTYATWLLEKARYEKTPMEELLLLNCLVSGVSGFARNLALLEEMTVQG
ncbi:Aste57867_2135 [Aphanomyces stellatus]|uniref:Aste57867_2135 protein n=1 Tax=Aphanomyces stellatus TaxID=120398 RepID=A0A485K6S5_9STRA|nr:hypothetical protein As57867_002130 [Aphanomyces stellatus]VFT79338.1 Aste57867_2135 [Aphanomyces stellatus]